MSTDLVHGLLSEGEDALGAGEIAIAQSKLRALRCLKLADFDLQDLVSQFEAAVVSTEQDMYVVKENRAKTVARSNDTSGQLIALVNGVIKRDANGLADAFEAWLSTQIVATGKDSYSFVPLIVSILAEDDIDALSNFVPKGSDAQNEVPNGLKSERAFFLRQMKALLIDEILGLSPMNDDDTESLGHRIMKMWDEPSELQKAQSKGFWSTFQRRAIDTTDDSDRLKNCDALALSSQGQHSPLTNPISGKRVSRWVLNKREGIGKLPSAFGDTAESARRYQNLPQEGLAELSITQSRSFNSMQKISAYSSQNAHHSTMPMRQAEDNKHSMPKGDVKGSPAGRNHTALNTITQSCIILSDEDQILAAKCCPYRKGTRWHGFTAANDSSDDGEQDGDNNTDTAQQQAAQDADGVDVRQRRVTGALEWLADTAAVQPTARGRALQAMRLEEDGKEAMRRQDWRAAEKAYEELLALAAKMSLIPLQYEALGCIGQARLETERYGEAAAVFERQAAVAGGAGVAAAGAEADALTSAAEAQCAAGRLEDGLRNLTVADARCKTAAAHGDGLWMDPSEVQRRIEAGIWEAHLRNVKWILRRGLILLQKGQSAAAAELLEECLKAAAQADIAGRSKIPSSGLVSLVGAIAPRSGSRDQPRRFAWNRDVGAQEMGSGSMGNVRARRLARLRCSAAGALASAYAALAEGTCGEFQGGSAHAGAAKARAAVESAESRAERAWELMLGLSVSLGSRADCIRCQAYAWDRLASAAARRGDRGAVRAADCWRRKERLELKLERMVLAGGDGIDVIDDEEDRERLGAATGTGPRVLAAATGTGLGRRMTRSRSGVCSVT